MESKPVTKKSGAAQRKQPAAQPPGPKWKTSAKEDGVRAQGPTARNSGKSMFPGVVKGNVANQEPISRVRTKDYPGGRTDVQPRPKGVRY